MREAKHTTMTSLVSHLSMMDWVLKESHWGKIIKYFRTTNHHLKSFLWFPYEPSKCPRNPMSVHKLHLPAFLFSHGKCHQKKKKKNLYPIWDLVNGAPAPHSTLKAEVALSCPVEFPEAPVESVRDISLFGPKETTAGKHPSPLITRMFTFSSSINLTNILSTNEFSFLPLPADIKKYFKILLF